MIGSNVIGEDFGESLKPRTPAFGMQVKRHFTKPDKEPQNMFDWAPRDVSVGKFKATVSAPTSWGDNAVAVMAQKYMRPGETSVWDVVSRVVKTTTKWGFEQNYFRSKADCEAFEAELAFLLLDQRWAPNSPVFYNLGTSRKQAVSACYIQSVDDSMEAILQLGVNEGTLFRDGSGSGTNFSSLRSSKEKLSGGGTSSGPVSFERGLDAVAGAIKSAGSTRRAAKIAILDIGHPDILEFIRCKALEEDKAAALIAAGYSAHFDDPQGAYASVAFQNANHSVRVTDAFMQAVEADEPWTLREVKTGHAAESVRARDLYQEICKAAWRCGDPGLQFHDATNRMHTSPSGGEIRGSNPCSEFVYLDDSACNLASINLLKYLGANDVFDVIAFQHTVDVSILAQEIFVGKAEYPTEKIRQNSVDFRPLGLGYANLGALLMAQGLAYDSDESRLMAAKITSLMTAQAYLQSARIARDCGGPFGGFEENLEAMRKVIAAHTKSSLRQPDRGVLADDVWREAQAVGWAYGFRNAQVTLLAPTGTIGILMGCDTLGIEPDFALEKTKQMVGGGTMSIVNGSVPRALRKLGYKTEAEILEESPELLEIELDCVKPEHRPVFDCANPEYGRPGISWRGHVEMMAAVQPFLSSAISKTVNAPGHTTPEEIGEIYTYAWQRELKAISVYRDGCKGSQPLSATASPAASAMAPKTNPIPGMPADQFVETVRTADGFDIHVYENPQARKDLERVLTEQLLKTPAFSPPPPVPARRRMPSDRQSLTHKFNIAGHEGYLTVGLYDDGTPGELFIRLSKTGSAVAGFADAWAVAFSLALQSGVSLEKLCEKFSGMRFEPSGWTGNPALANADSVVDYVARWLRARYVAAGPGQDQAAPGRPAGSSEPAGASAKPSVVSAGTSVASASTRICGDCGGFMQPSGSCYACPRCGTTSGCS